MINIEVISYHRSGNSFPIVIQYNSKKFLVKLRAGLSGEYSLLSEWFGNQAGSLIGLNTRQPHWILLPDSLKYDDIYIEVRDLIDKSLGVNIGFEYIDNVEVFDIGEISKIDKDQQIEIYLFDLLMLNVDRTNQNCNLLINESGVLITDFDSSLIFTDLFKNVNLSMNKQILQCLKSNPFYQKVDDCRLKTFINKVNQIDFERIIFEIPNELISLQNKGMIYKKIEDKKSTNWNLREMLDNLENTKLETGRERNMRINKNREKLEKLVSSTHNTRS
ncbi:MAG: hypothetical protein JW717_05135 [Marinilabiliaceae bacterium]|nr:hypothetical protein [Marinilabiliaceae bacterium]